MSMVLIDYVVKVKNTEVITTVVKTIPQLDQSLRDLLSTIYSNKDRRNVKHVVGLDIEKHYYCRGDNEFQVVEKTAIVKLCFNTRCLIIQLLHMEEPPCSLAEFLQRQELTFVGVNIKHCLDALSSDYGITCRNTVDLGQLAASVWKNEKYRLFGLLDLAYSLCFLDSKKDLLGDTSVEALGSWGTDTLSKQQIEAATLGAFICFCVGNHLFVGYLPEFNDGKSSLFD